MIELQTNSRNGKIAILGGGLSGLVTGYLLNQNGESIEILEQEHETGGLMRSLVDDGWTFDYGGSHIIFSKNTEALNFMLDLLGENYIKNRRNTKILYNRSLVKYPFENGLSDLPKAETFECLNSFIQTLLCKEKDKLAKPKNLNEWSFYTFGEGIARKYLIPYNEKIWKLDAKLMGLDWVERIPSPPVEDILKSSLGIATEGYTHQLHFYYPKNGGIQALIKSLEAKIAQKITLNYNVKRVGRENDHWVVSDGKTEKSFNRIISTIPVQRLVAAVDAPQEVRNAISALKYNSLITVMLGINKNKLNDLSWLYIPDKTVLTHRVSFPSNFSLFVVPPGKSSILAEITCHFGDDVWRMKDSEIIERTIDDLVKLGIICNKDDICFNRVHREEYAYVLNDLDYLRNLSIVKNYFQEIGISLIGRFAEFMYLNMDACIQHSIAYVKGH